MTTRQPDAGRRALVVVDVQEDFVEDGSLAVAGGRDVATRIAAHLHGHGDDYDLVVATRDWHDPHGTNGGHFHAPGEDPDHAVTWPHHCVAGTPGAEWAAEAAGAITTRADLIVSKGQGRPAYSGFEGADDEGRTLDAVLRSAGVSAVEVCGIATDYCVRATALDAADLGFDVALLPGLHAGVAPATTRTALAEMAASGVRLAGADQKAAGAVVGRQGPTDIPPSS